MTRYSVYLELGPDGPCMAHVPELPGCMVRAEGRQAAMAALPAAIREYMAWLRAHGDPSPVPARIELRVRGVSRGGGPFDPGDRAALFPPDRAPLSRDDMEEYLRLASYSRADLLRLVRGLPAEVLDWKVEPEAMSIRQVLRHIGNSEQWYVSRLVSPRTLPPEWKDDEAMPPIRFLRMERRTAAGRLRRLSGEELARVCYPKRWTDHPDEPWTARKALRRMLEHEREHTGQVGQILAVWRAHLLARIAAERAALLSSLLWLDDEALSRAPVIADWTAKDLLAHIAAWDDWHAERRVMTMTGRERDLAGAADLDQRNAVIHAERRGWTLERALEECLSARARFLAALARASDQDLHRRPAADGVSPLRVRAMWRHRHDAAHAAHVDAWRRAHRFRPAFGPKYFLLAALHAAREDLCATVALVPEADRETRPLVGQWTLKDVVGHVADWDRECARGLRRAGAGRAPSLVLPRGVEEWNRAHVKARRRQSWAETWADFTAARREVVRAAEKLDRETLRRPFASPWQPDDTAYRWIAAWLAHDREHAAEVRAAMKLRWPKRLLRLGP